jgi:hypothetical protein
VKISSAEAWAEYGVTIKQLKPFEARIIAELDREKATLRKFTGKLPRFRGR